MVKSKLSTDIIKSRLLKNTKAGDIYVLFTPLAILNVLSETNKVFLGEVKNNRFIITLNKSFYPIPYFIEGTYKEAENNESEIEYTIKPRLFIIWFTRILQIIISLIVTILILIIAKLALGIVLVTGYILINVVLPIYLLSKKKRYMEQELRRIIKIE